MAMTIDAAFEAAKLKVGEVSRQEFGRISRKEFQRFAVAVDDLNPLYFSDEVANKVNRTGVVAPPLFLTSVMGWRSGPPNEQLKGDGTEGSETGGLSLGGLRLMGGGQDIEFHQEVRDNVEVISEASLDSVELKEGSSGRFLIIKILRRYFDRAGFELLTCRETFIAR